MSKTDGLLIDWDSAIEEWMDEFNDFYVEEDEVDPACVCPMRELVKGPCPRQVGGTECIDE